VLKLPLCWEELCKLQTHIHMHTDVVAGTYKFLHGWRYEIAVVTGSNYLTRNRSAGTSESL
jgi:hypothetical protein